MMGMHHVMGRKLMIKCDNCTLVSAWSAAGTVRARSYTLSHNTTVGRGIFIISILHIIKTGGL